MSEQNQQSARLSADAVTRFDELTKILNNDAAMLLEHAKREPSEASRRSAVRAVFAAIEGMVSGLKGLIVEPFPRVRHHFTDAEIALLREEHYLLTDRGDAKTQTRYLRLEENLRFVWKMFVKEWRIDPDVDFSGEGWKAFCSSVEVRNRITHPRQPRDLSISDAEFSQVEKAYQFVYATTMRNIARSLQAARRQIYELLDRLLHSLALSWLDSLKQEGTSPVGRPLTPGEARDLHRLEAEVGTDIVRTLRAWEVLGGPDESPSLLQRGADYRAWRLKNRASAT